MEKEVLDFIQAVGFPAAAWFITFVAMNKHYNRIIDRILQVLEDNTRSNDNLRSAVMEVLNADTQNRLPDQLDSV